MRRAVLHGEAQRQGPSERHGVDRAKRLQPEGRADIAVAETEGQSQQLAARGFDPVEMPCRGARKPMLRCPRRVPVGAEPREDDRDATADCPARRKSAVGAGEENRLLARRLPGSQVRSLQVKLARHTIERDLGLDQPVFRFNEIENAGNAEFGSQLRGLHRSFLFPGDHHRRLRRISASRPNFSRAQGCGPANSRAATASAMIARVSLSLSAP